MARSKSNQDTTMLEMALVGYEFQKQKIDEKIREIRDILGGARSSADIAPSTESGRRVKTAAAPKKRRTLSAEARKRIAAAQKRRWAEHRKNQAAQEKA